MGGYALCRASAQGRARARLRAVRRPRRLRTYAGRLLSGGERKMLAMARVMMASPSVVLLDEPTSNLAPIPSARLLEHDVPALAARRRRGGARRAARRAGDRRLGLGLRAGRRGGGAAGAERDRGRGDIGACSSAHAVNRRRQHHDRFPCGRTEARRARLPGARDRGARRDHPRPRQPARRTTGTSSCAPAAPASTAWRSRLRRTSRSWISTGTCTRTIRPSRCPRSCRSTRPCWPRARTARPWCMPTRPRSWRAPWPVCRCARSSARMTYRRCGSRPAASPPTVSLASSATRSAPPGYWRPSGRARSACCKATAWPRGQSLAAAMLAAIDVHVLARLTVTCWQMQRPLIEVDPDDYRDLPVSAPTMTTRCGGSTRPRRRGSGLTPP